MKVTKSEENGLEFDNGLIIDGEGDQDCCAHNYLDFEQFEVGTEFPTMTAGEFVDTVTLAEDGFAMVASDGMPKWCQARSQQNGYYSSCTTLRLTYNGKTVLAGRLEGAIAD